MLKFAAPSIRNGGQSQLPLPAGPGGVFPRRPWRCLWLDLMPQWPAGRTRERIGSLHSSSCGCGQRTRSCLMGDAPSTPPRPRTSWILDSLGLHREPPRTVTQRRRAPSPGPPTEAPAGLLPPRRQASQTRPFLHIIGLNCLYCVSGLEGKVSHHQNASLSRRVTLLWAFLPQKDLQ